MNEQPEFASGVEDTPTPKVQDEIATTGDGKDITRGFVEGLLRSQDRILLTRGGQDLAIYKRVLEDYQVASTFQQRRLGVVARDTIVEPGGNSANDRAAAAFTEELLPAIGWDNVTNLSLYGVFYGFSVAELIWKADGRFLTWEQIRVRDRARFRFNNDLELRLLTPDNLSDGIPADAPYFWCFATGADHSDEPYGLGLSHWLYWPTLFKRNGLKFWSIFLERLAQPVTVGTFPTGAGKEDQAKLLATLASLQVDSAAVVPEGYVLDLLEATRSSSPDYSSFISVMDAAISKAVVGQTMTTDDGSSRSQAEVHLDVRADLIKADHDLVTESFRAGPLKWLIRANFGPSVKIPLVHRDITLPEDMDKLSKRDLAISKVGFRPTLAQVVTTYGGEWEEVVNSPPPPTVDEAKAAFEAAGIQVPATYFRAAKAPTNKVEAQATALEELSMVASDAVLVQLRNVVDTSSGFEELQTRIAQIFPELDYTDLGEVISKAILLAELTGASDVDDEEEGRA